MNIPNHFKQYTDPETGIEYLELENPAAFGLPQFRMVKVPAGNFKPDGFSKPVGFDMQTFYLAETQVTQEFWQAVMKNNPARFNGLQNPVERVNWFDCHDFCIALNQLLVLEAVIEKHGDEKYQRHAGKTGFRLPTEAEWEWAARGGGVVQTHGRASLQNNMAPQYEYAGTNRLENVGWFNKNNDYETKPVGLKFPNQLGLYDMSGNVWEWCEEVYENEMRNLQQYPTGFQNPSGIEKQNPSDLKKSEGSYRVLRGGSWFNFSYGARVGGRSYGAPDARGNHFGFRLLFAF